MKDRLSLHEELCGILGTRYVYFQSPENVKMVYPCIRYSRTSPSKSNANDRLYLNTNRYELIVIDRDPDTKLPDMIVEHFPMCTLDRAYVSNNLNHYVITLYY